MAFREPTSERTQFARKQRRLSTRCEDELWRELRGRKLGGWKFKRQAPIGRYFVDFFCDTARLIVEADGPAHDTDEQRAHDRQRDVWFRSHRYRVPRFGQDEIFSDMSCVLRLIADALAQTQQV
ncbi:endonuclease domain-containing protein [Terrarubrum flagellatum]|uniref:endonuclease domain-containing protein n=1 Tax=Terrirubrum flagellatum TaxID=2895980 RepID=UPI0031454D95